MKQKKLFILMFISLFLCILTSCGSNEIGKHDNLTKVTFELEGGSYKNSTTPVKHYYNLKDNESMLIYELSSLTSSNLEKSGFVFAGWYQERNEVDEKVTYAKEWNFKTDKITKDGITLYAYWKKAINFTFDVCYKDVNNEVKILGSYPVDPEDEETRYFYDVLSYANKRKGYTSIGYVDEEGNPWDDDFFHQCDETNPSVKVFGNYIEGEYVIVKDAEDLDGVSTKNIYLMNDIDMDGNELLLNNYKGIFEGNGHTIKNFTIPFNGKKGDLVTDHEFSDKKSIYVSLFGNVENATIRNVNFENLSVKISTTYDDIDRIIVSPIVLNVTNSTIKNVSIKGEILIQKLPSNFVIDDNGTKKFDETKLLKFGENYLKKDDESVVENITIDMEIKNNLK